MGYKILVLIILFNFLPVASAMEFPVSSPPVLNGTLSQPGKTANDLAAATTSVDQFQICFKNSTWVVPPQTLLAYLYSNANFQPTVDQTVWVFNRYNQGYFSGKSFTAINNGSLSERFLVGTVTSEGRVYITFYSGTSTSTSLVNGLGNLYVQSSGQCYFIMQMNSGQDGVSGLVHWSYMIPVKPGDVFYKNLPGTGMSVPQFLAQF